MESSELEEEIEKAEFSHDLKNYPIFERTSPHEVIPDGFSALTIRLDAKATSQLNFQKEFQEAHLLIKKGYKIVFDLDLGLFHDLQKPLFHEAQFQALSFAIDHFVNELTSEIKEHLLGVIVARLNLNFRNNFKELDSHQTDFQEWLQAKGASPDDVLFNLYLRDVAIEYILLLVNHLPLGIRPIVLLDASEVQDPYVFVKLTLKDRFERILPAIKNPPFAQGHLIWQEGVDFGGFIGRKVTDEKKSNVATVGLLMPSYDVVNPMFFEGLEHVLKILVSQKIPFKILTDELLTTEWDGLDILIIKPEIITQNTLRKLQGFCAAGGKIVTIGQNTHNFIESELFENWIQTN